MKKRILIVSALSSTFFLNGCEQLQRHLYRDYAAQPLIPNVTPTGTPNGPKSTKFDELKRVINFKKALFEDGVITPECSDLNQCSLKERNDVAAGLIVASDNICTEHMKTIYGNEATYNLGFGTATSLFAGASTVAASTGAKTLFSAIALFSNAERSLINESVYRTMLSTAISSKIRESRKAARTTLIDNLDNKLIDKYSFDRAVQDVVDYHSTCSFMSGLELALKEGTQNSVANKRAAMNQSLKLVTIEYDTRKREIASIQVYLSTDAQANTAALAKSMAEDPQLRGLTTRINTLNDSLKKLEIVE